MSQRWPEDARQPRRRKPPRYGGEMDAVLDIIRRDDMNHAARAAALAQLYPEAHPGPVSALAYNTRRAIERGDEKQAAKQVRDFIHEALAATGEVPPAPAAPWWRRLWQSDFAMGWLFAAFATAALLTAVEVWV